MSLWKSLFGGGDGGGDPAAAKIIKQVDYKGCTIAARPYSEGGQFQVAGTITKQIGGEQKSHRFIRADRCTSAEDAADAMIGKAKQLVDQQGDKIFG